MNPFERALLEDKESNDESLRIAMPRLSFDLGKLIFENLFVIYNLTLGIIKRYDDNPVSEDDFYKTEFLLSTVKSDDKKMDFGLFHYGQPLSLGTSGQNNHGFQLSIAQPEIFNDYVTNLLSGNVLQIDEKTLFYFDRHYISMERHEISCPEEARIGTVYDSE